MNVTILFGIGTVAVMIEQINFDNQSEIMIKNIYGNFV